MKNVGTGFSPSRNRLKPVPTFPVPEPAEAGSRVPRPGTG